MAKDQRLKPGPLELPWSLVLGHCLLGDASSETCGGMQSLRNLSPTKIRSRSHKSFIVSAIETALASAKLRISHEQDQSSEIQAPFG
jgi:hypothetical protein